MRLEHQGVVLSFETAASALPGTPTGLAFELSPAAPNAHVDLELRRGLGVAERMRAERSQAIEGDGALFIAELPALEPGESLGVTITGYSNGERVPAEGDEGAASFEIVALGEVDLASGGGVERRIEELAPEDGAARSRVLDRLRERGVTTAAELLALSHEALPDLSSAERTEVSRLTAHAALATAIGDPGERDALIEAGLTTPARIAAVALGEFSKSAGEALTANRAEEVHRIASAQSALLDSFATATATSAAAMSGLASVQRCGCKDCEAATSPLAYLTDLVNYITATVHIMEGSTLPIDSELNLLALTDLLELPLAELAVSCKTVSDPVREVRLTIETLRRYLGSEVPAESDVMCSPFQLPLEHVVAGDVDGDGRDELVVAFRGSRSSWLQLPPNVLGGFWVMDFDPRTGRWSHLAPTDTPVGADFFLDPGLVVRKTICADIDGDGRDEIVVNVAREDGALDAVNGESWFWILEWVPDQKRWAHLDPQGFEQTRSDLRLDDQTARVKQLLHGDVDGEGREELVISAPASGKPNAFWVFDLVEVPAGNRVWQALSPGLDSSQPAFEFDPPSSFSAGWPARVPFTADVNQDGRDEVLAAPDAPGGLGSGLWAMTYDPPTPMVPGQVGTWRHFNPGSGGAANEDLLAVWPWPARVAHAFGGSTRGMNSSVLLLSAEQRLNPPSDPNVFWEVRWDGSNATWTWPDQIDCSTQNRSVSAALAADVDGDLSDEVVAVIESQGKRSAWVMDRQPNGSWQHLSSITAHPFGADVEWTPLDYSFRGMVAADVDRQIGGSLHTELVFYGSRSNQIWVLRYDADAETWRHLSPVVPDDLGARYMRAAYAALLAQLGTSHEELRSVQAGSQEGRDELAGRLGIPVRIEPGQPETVERLLLAPTQLSESRLEEFFGLVDTTRNPLSSAPVREDSRSQVRRIELEGVQWSRNPWAANIGLEGDLELSLTEVPGAKVEVMLRRPDGLPVASGTGDPEGRLWLTEMAQSGLKGWVEIDYSEDATEIQVGALPKVAAWRLDGLRRAWDEQDWPAGAFDAAPGAEQLVAIDPDVVRPDDFRVPLEKVSSGDPDGPFDIWVRRRAWVDARLAALEALQPDLDPMLDLLRPPSGPPPTTPEDYPWDSAPPTADWDGLAQTIRAGGPAAEAAAGTIREDVWLPPDAFLRLVDLRARLASGQLGTSEWEDVRSILVLALKRRRRAVWRAEEAAAGVTLGPATFWTATRALVEGRWPPVFAANLPLIDPETVTLLELPQGDAGAVARGLWAARRRRLDELVRLIRAQRVNGLEDMLVEALGPASAPGGWRARAAELAEDLDSSTPATAAAARQAARTELGLEPAELTRIAGASAKLDAGQALTDAEWLDVELLLTAGRKRKVEYTTWLAEELSLGTLLAYWRARQAALPRWRASTEERQAWEAELARRSRAPAVDPDRFLATWLRTTKFGDRALTLYGARRNWLNGRAQALRAARPSGASALAQLDAVLRTALFPSGEAGRLARDLSRRRQARSAAAVLDEVFGAAAQRIPTVLTDLSSTDAATADSARRIAAEEFWLDEDSFETLATIAAKPTATVTAAEWSDFERILANAVLVGRIVAIESEARRRGVRSRALLAQLALRPVAYGQILRLRTLAAAGREVLDEEWDAVVAIALRAEKERRFGAWLLDERGTTPENRVRVGPDSFREPEDEEAEPEPDPWLVSADERRRWESALRSRTEQQETVLGGLRDAVSRVEEATLVILRDELLDAVAPARGDAATWIADHFLLDARAGGCRITTRAAHAIDRLLALLWSLRTGQLRDTYPQLTLIAPHFDDDWRWIGSYGSWRSAVLARLHPENLVRPSLRRRKTPVFSELLRDLRSGRELSPLRARRLARRYANYFRDVCSLDLGALACTRVNGFVRDESARNAKPRPHDFLFAPSPVSGRVYWSTLELGQQPTDPGYQHGFWNPIDELKQSSVAGIVGAATYTPAQAAPQSVGTSAGWVYLFAITRDLEESGLVFVRYNLGTREWEAPQELEVPRTGPFKARVLSGGIAQPPRLAFEVSRRDEAGRPVTTHFTATMNGKGVDWNADGLVELPRWSWSSVTGTLARTPRALFSLDADASGLVELAAVPDGAGPIEFWTRESSGFVSRGSTSRSVEPGSLVLVGDFDGDGRTEVAWTLEMRPTNLGRSTAVLVEKLTGGGWGPHLPDPTRPDGASAAAYGGDRPAIAVVAADLSGSGGDEILLHVQDHFEVVNLGQTRLWTGAWGSFWLIERQGGSYRRTRPYSADSDGLTEYARTQLVAAFAVAPDELAAAARSVSGDFDGDKRDELVVFVAAKQNSAVGPDLSRGNDFWALDRRATGKLRRLGQVGDQVLGTVGDLTVEPDLVADAIAADVDGDGRDELIVLPYVTAAQRGSLVWVVDFQPGGASDPAEGGQWVQLAPIDLSLQTTPAAHAVAADLDGDGADEIVLFGAGRSWVRKYDPARGSWQALPDLDGALPANSTVALAAGGKFLPGGAEQIVVALGSFTPEQALDGLAYNVNGDQAQRQRYRRVASSPEIRLLSMTGPQIQAASPSCSHPGLRPNYSGSGTDWVLDETVSVSERRARTKFAFEQSAGLPPSALTYLWEAFYGLPIAIALELQRSGHYTQALDWYRLVYDYTRPLAERRTYYGLEAEAQIAGAVAYGEPLLSWLRDPLDVHAIAATRPGTYTRATVQLVIRCLIEYGDAEFTADTSEAIERARLLYETALGLLDTSELRQSYGGCEDVIARYTVRIGHPGTTRAVRSLAQRLASTVPSAELERSLEEIVEAVSRDAEPEERIREAEAVVSRALERAGPPPTLVDASRAPAATLGVREELLRRPDVAATLASVAELVLAEAQPAATNGGPQPVGSTSSAIMAAPRKTLPRLWGGSNPNDIWFCVSPNPVLRALRLHAELNLYKIRTCRNIGGLRRELDFYSGATDQETGMPAIGAGGQLVVPPQRSARPTPYRYATLIARAKELTQTAQALESQLLTALERRDAETYSLMQARQDAQVAQETVRLSELQVRQATDSVTLAQLRQERAQVEQDWFTDLLEAGESDQEREAMTLLAQAADHQRLASALGMATTVSYGAQAAAYATAAYFATTNKAELIAQSVSAATQGLSSASGVASMEAQIKSTLSELASRRANLERMREDWQLRQRLATEDIRIAAQETRIEEDSVRVAEQQREISELEADHAEQLVDFLHTKFTNTELYDWMSRVLEQAYGSVLQHATATARMAAAQLAFERQEGAPPQIATDYWEPPSEDGAEESVGEAVDRRGLTGAERLLRDIVELDQYAFETNRRKLQLTKTFSLAEMAPLELERLRTTGVTTFATPQEAFDRDFPGHYLRLVKRVSMSLVALVPPIEGIHATLSTTGISRVVVGPELFQSIVVRRPATTVALTAPTAATGVFEFEPEPELTNPFELDGVDIVWEVRLPKAGNRFDFGSIADLMLTVSYTALDNEDYRQQVVRRLDRQFEGERALSLRHDFPDAWWDLHNPEQTDTPLAVSFDTARTDFPTNLSDLEIDQLAVVVSSEAEAPRGLTVRLRYAEDPPSGGARTSSAWLPASPADGFASTRRGNATAWVALLGKGPAGRWWLSLPDTEAIREWLEEDQLEDLLLVVSYRGRTPAWPV